MLSDVSDIWRWIMAVSRHWMALLSGGIASLIGWLWQEFSSQPRIPVGWFYGGGAFCFLCACFLAWNEEAKARKQLEEERPWFEKVTSGVTRPAGVVDLKGTLPGRELQFVFSNRKIPASRVSYTVTTIVDSFKQHLSVSGSTANDVGGDTPLTISGGGADDFLSDLAGHGDAYFKVSISYRDSRNGFPYSQHWYLRFPGVDPVNRSFKVQFLDASLEQRDLIDAYLSKAKTLN